MALREGRSAESGGRGIGWCGVGVGPGVQASGVLVLLMGRHWRWFIQSNGGGGCFIAGGWIA